MNDKLEERLKRIRELENELEQEFAAKSQLMAENFKKRKMIFEEAVREQQKKFKLPLGKYLLNAKIRNTLSAPFIYVMIVPLAFVDLSVFLYQHICFRLYRIPIVKRKEYFVVDRQHLVYLNLLEKFNCVYCGYGTSVAAYVKETIARTEQFWCPIKHASHVKDPHGRYYKFFEYGDAEAYRENYDVVKCDFE